MTREDLIDAIVYEAVENPGYMHVLKAARKVAKSTSKAGKKMMISKHGRVGAYKKSAKQWGKLATKGGRSAFKARMDTKQFKNVAQSITDRMGKHSHLPGRLPA